MFLSKYSSCLVTLPLVLAPMMAMAVKPAAAAASPAVEAVVILSKARAADGKCRFLALGEKAELSRYAARAEVAAASQSSTAEAKDATAAGSAQGRKANCTPDLEADVRETLQAAREAMADAKGKRKAARAPVADPAPEPDEPKFAGGNGGVALYARVVKAYYLEHQCHSLDSGEAHRFWKKVVKLHREALAEAGRNKVARLMASAEQRANGSRCGGNALAQIRAGYDEVTSR